MSELKEDLKGIAAALLHNIPFLLVCGAAGLLIGMAYLQTVNYRYIVMVQVVPVQNTNNGLSSMLGGLSGIVSLAGLNTGSGNSQVDLYKAELVSTDVAQEMLNQPGIVRHIFADRWDRDTGQWILRRSRLRSIARPLLGLPPKEPTPPTVLEMQGVLTTQVTVQGGGLGEPTIDITYADADPAFAKRFLLALHHAADEKLRARTITRATSYIAYLQKELATVTSAEHREALIQTLTEQERSKMFAGANVAYAAEVFTQPVSSFDRVVPKPLTVLAMIILLVTGAGAALILLLTRLGRQLPPGMAQRFLRMR